MIYVVFMDSSSFELEPITDQELYKEASSWKHFFAIQKWNLKKLIKNRKIAFSGNLLCLFLKKRTAMAQTFLKFFSTLWALPMGEIWAQAERISWWALLVRKKHLMLVCFFQLAYHWEEISWYNKVREIEILMNCWWDLQSFFIVEENFLYTTNKLF